MRIIDAQVHIWAAARQRRPSAGACLHRGELLAEMDEAGVDAAVLHRPSPGISARMRCARERPPRRATRSAVHPGPGAARPAGDQPSAARDLARTSRPMRPALSAGARRPAILALRRHDGLALARGGRSRPARRHPRLALPARAHPHRRAPPNLRLIIDHCGVKRGGKGREAFAEVDAACALARFPNVALKATGAPCHSLLPYPFHDIHDGLHRLYDAFGPDRFFWGTDITRMPCSWRQCITLFTEELPWLQGPQMERVMGRGSSTGSAGSRARRRRSPSPPRSSPQFRATREVLRRDGLGRQDRLRRLRVRADDDRFRHRAQPPARRDALPSAARRWRRPIRADHQRVGPSLDAPKHRVVAAVDNAFIGPAMAASVSGVAKT